MSAPAPKSAEEGGEKPKKSKKLLFIIIGVLVLALAGAAAAFILLKKNAAEDGEEVEEEPVAAVHKVDPKHPPTYLPLDSMVVNLADPGGNRYIQIGLTLQLQDAHTGDAVKAFMPSIRSRILVILSKRTAEDVLSAEGKSRLGNDIIAAVSEVMGYPAPKAEDEGKKKRGPASPVQAVLFSSFIVQ
jgi:flagellar FliL protein